MAYQRSFPALLLTFILCCGDIGPGDGIYSLPHRIKRQEPLIDHVIDANGRTTTFFTIENHKDIAHPPTRALEKEAQELIDEWDNQHEGRTGPSSNLVKLPNKKTQSFRIDLQGIFKKNNKNYYNLQVQINNVPRKGSTTVAHVIAPDGISAQNMHRAFTNSLNKHAKVCLENENTQVSVNCQGSGGGGGKGNKGNNKGNKRPGGK